MAESYLVTWDFQHGLQCKPAACFIATDLLSLLTSLVNSSSTELPVAVNAPGSCQNLRTKGLDSERRDTQD